MQIVPMNSSTNQSGNPVTDALSTNASQPVENEQTAPDLNRMLEKGAGLELVGEPCLIEADIVPLSNHARRYDQIRKLDRIHQTVSV